MIIFNFNPFGDDKRDDRDTTRFKIVLMAIYLLFLLIFGAWVINQMINR
jgi:hypothetical protein